MEKQVLSTIAEHGMLVPGDSIVVGLSGGADSVALTHFLLGLSDFDLQIICVHVHHGLRGDEADRDAGFCKEFCEQLGIELVVFEKDAAAEARKMGVTVEEAGRVLRYDCFNQVLRRQGFNKIAVAHNANDTAETIIMQIMRGAGGIRGIPAVNGNIIRPLTDTSREGILEYCAGHGLTFCTDSTNNANDYTRNWVRNVLLPQIEANLNPSAKQALQRLAKISGDEADFLDKIAKNAFSECVQHSDNGLKIDLEQLGQHDVAIKRRIVRIALGEALGGMKDITYDHVESLLALETSQSGKRVSLPKGYIAERVYHKICIKIPVSVDDFSVTLPRNTPVHIPQLEATVHLGDTILRENAFTKALDCGKITDVQIRNRLKGDRIFFSNVGTKKIKDFFTDKKIPRENREKAVFIACGQDIILIMGEDFAKPIESHKFDPESDSNTIYLQIWNE